MTRAEVEALVGREARRLELARAWGASPGAHELADRLIAAEEEGNGAAEIHGGEPDDRRIVSAQDFAAVEEPGAEPLVGEPGQVLIPEGGDVMIYGDGGASKTTLAIDLACHLAAGDDWLGIEVPRPVRVLLIEAEGPRALFRDKLRRKLDAWGGSDLGNRLYVYERPWADFRFPDAEVAALIGVLEIDVMVVGPLTRVGMDELGTLQEVRDFTDRVARFRADTGRRLTVGLVHHENKGGAVSGAWEGAGDTLFHAQVHGRGETALYIQKARWASDWHKQNLKLAWTEGEGFEVKEDEDRDLLAEIVALLKEKPDRDSDKLRWTAKEIASKKEGGIGAGETAVKATLEANLDTFASHTKEAAKALGRHPNATIWELAERCVDASAHLNAPASPRGGAGEGAEVHSPYRDAPLPDAPPPPALEVHQPANAPAAPRDEDGAA